jgi:hypothetical protein
MAGLEGGPCLLLEEASGQVSLLELAAEVMAGLESGLFSLLEKAAGSASPLQ